MARGERDRYEALLEDHKKAFLGLDSQIDKLVYAEELFTSSE